MLPSGEVERKLRHLASIVTEDGDEDRGRLARAFQDAEVRAVRRRLRDLLQRQNGWQLRILRRADEAAEGNGRDVLAEGAVGRDVEGAARGGGGRGVGRG